MILSPVITLPRSPSNEKDLVRWAQEMQAVLGSIYRILAMRIEELTLQGTVAQMPAADGRQKFYFATDTNTLYYDDGAWKAV